MRKNFIPGNFSQSIAAETRDAICLQKSLLEKQQNVPNTCTILPLKKIFYQNLLNLNRCIFQIPLKYIKLVIPKILFILVLCSFDFYFKITRLPLPNKVNPPPHQKKNFCPPPPAETFLKFLTLPSPQAGAKGGACPETGDPIWSIIEDLNTSTIWINSILLKIYHVTWISSLMLFYWSYIYKTKILLQQW